MSHPSLRSHWKHLQDHASSGTKAHLNSTCCTSVENGNVMAEERCKLHVKWRGFFPTNFEGDNKKKTEFDFSIILLSTILLPRIIIGLEERKYKEGKISNRTGGVENIRH